MTTKDQPKIAFAYSEELSQYQLSPEHPLRPIRLKHMHELMKATGLMNLANIASVQPRLATRDEIESAHDLDYVSNVSAVSNGSVLPDSSKYGLGTPDNPIWKGMYDNTALCVGTPLTASELVMSGRANIAFAPAGGVHHHAMRRYASGFGVFNDAVIAMNTMIKSGLRIAYVDIDCHHGDGVQAGYYDSDQVLTISIHESGQWLFPGTGHVQEIGENNGLGYSVNIPLAPYTQDTEWHAAFDELITPLIKTFKPDVLFTQLGIDTHFQDPLTHMSLTTQGFNLAVKKAGQIRFRNRQMGRGWWWRLRFFRSRTILDNGIGDHGRFQSAPAGASIFRFFERLNKIRRSGSATKRKSLPQRNPTIQLKNYRRGSCAGVSEI